MSFERELRKRSDDSCELCGKNEFLNVYEVQPFNKKATLKESIWACKTCTDQIENADLMQANHWRCLNDSI